MRILYSIFLVAGACLYGSEAEYLGGTVKSIPKNIAGELDLTDSSDLIFTYGNGKFRLPYENIKGFEMAPAKSSQRRSGLLGHIPAPHLPWSQPARLLNLSFRGEDRSSEVISFKLTGKDLATTEWTLKSRIDEPVQSNTAGRARLPESWWGDQFWRTTRNMTQRPAADVAPAGTK